MTISLRDPKTQKILLLSVVGIAILYVNFLTELVPFTYKAQAGEIGTLSEQYQKLSGDLTKARQTLQSKAYLEKEFELLHGKWERAQLLLPTKQEMSSLLRAITLLGDRAGVRFILFRPNPPTLAQYHTEHPIEITVDGGYHEIGTFLSDLSNMERILTITNLTLETPRKEASESPARASFIATTYTLGGSGIAPEGNDAASAAGGTGRGGGIARQAQKAKQTVTRKLEGARKGGTEE